MSKDKFSFLEPLAKELGYKDAKEMRDALGKEQAGRGGAKGAGFGNVGGAGGVGTGFLGGREVGSGFGVGVKSRLAKGASVKEALGGGFAEFKQTFSRENIKRRMFEKTFSGPGFVSAFARGKLKKKYGTSPTKEKSEGDDTSGTGAEVGGNPYLGVLAKSSMALPSMARDVNVMRQNLQKLVKLWGGKAATSKEVDVGSSEKLPQEEIDRISAEVDAKNERTEDINYFAEQDKKEAEQEAARAKSGEKSTTPTPAPEKKEEGGGGLIDTIMQMFSGGLMQGIKSLFSPKMLMKVLSKVFLPIVIIGTIFSGIVDGFKKYQETGSFSEAIIAGLGGMLSFLTFGLFGEDTLRNLWTAVSDFLSPITDTISGIFSGIKDFFKKLFGMGGEEDKSKKEIEKTTPKMPDTKQFVSDTVKSSGASEEKTKDIAGLFGAVEKGDVGGLFGKAQEIAAKYPEPPSSPTSPTPTTAEGVPMDQAQRNFELNKKLTGEASKALGVPLEAPAPPTPATPSTPVQTAPTPAAEMSDSDKIKQLEGYIEGNKTRFAKREADAERHIASFKKRYPNDPERVKELEEDYKQTLDVERKEMESANAGFQGQIDAIKKSSKGTVSSGGTSTPSVESGGGSAAPTSGSEVSAAGGGGEVSAAGGGGGDSGGGAESLSSEATAPSGSDISQASSDVAEGQRMESAADAGSVVNAPTNNNSSPVMDKTRPQTVNVYNEELAGLLGTT